MRLRHLTSTAVVLGVLLAGCGAGDDDPAVSATSDAATDVDGETDAAGARTEAIANLMDGDAVGSEAEAVCYVEAIDVDVLERLDRLSPEFQADFAEDRDSFDDDLVAAVGAATDACYGEGAPFATGAPGTAEASAPLAIANLTSGVNAMSQPDAECLVRTFGEDELGRVDNFSPTFQSSFDSTLDDAAQGLPDGTVVRFLDALQTCFDVEAVGPGAEPDADLALANLTSEPDALPEDEARCFIDEFGVENLGAVDNFSQAFKQAYERELEGQDAVLDDLIRGAATACR